MNPSTRIWTACIVASAVWVACSSPPEPVEPSVPTASSNSPKKPPPPPKCESLGDKCEAKSDTRASIAGADYRFTPPKGWLYAQLAGGTVTQPDEAGPVLVISSLAPESAAAALRKQREERLGDLCEMSGLTLPPKTALGAPDDTGEAGSLKLLYWQREKVKRGDAEGSLLVFAGPSEGKELFGIGFVPLADTTKADEAIEASIQSLELEQGDADKPPESAEGKGKAP